MNRIDLKFHEKRCNICRYYRLYQSSSECLFLGRSLSMVPTGYADFARYCDGWKKRPKTWEILAEKNPFWEDRYIPRKTQINLRKQIDGRCKTIK